MDMANIKEEVGKKIRAIRKAKGLTQEKLGEKADLNYKYIGEVERGEVNPSVETLSAVANALNISLSQLFAENWQLPLIPLDHQLPLKDIQLIRAALPSFNQILKISPKDIQLIKEALPFLEQILKMFSSWGTKELESINKALVPLNKLFSKE